MTEEQKQKISLSKLGKKRPPFSKEWKENLSKGLKGINTWSKGRKFSEEHKQKLNLTRIGRRHTEGTKKKMSIIQTKIQPKGNNSIRWKDGLTESRRRWNKKRAEYSERQRKLHPETMAWFRIQARVKEKNMPTNITKKDFED